MIKSMTGYGRGECIKNNKKIAIELKAVNHRYLDINIKEPKILNALENDIRNYLKSNLSRGKVDVYVSYEDLSDAQYDIVCNKDVAEKYFMGLAELSKQFDIDNPINAVSLSRYPDVFEVKEIDTDPMDLWDVVKEALSLALEQFIDNRKQEGERLSKDIFEKLDDVSKCVEKVEKRSPEIIEEYKTKLKNKVNDLFADKQMDESRIAFEVTMYADKICVDEEIVRLKSHVSEMKSALLSDEEVGRKLDFVTQELNREANTLLSKSTDVEISNIGIELKTLIEKIREQIQNVE